MDTALSILQWMASHPTDNDGINLFFWLCMFMLVLVAVLRKLFG